jgi:DNA sulfur modification protein DndD
MLLSDYRKKSASQSPAKQNKISDLELACEREQEKLQAVHEKIVKEQSTLDRHTKEIAILKDTYKEKGGESFEKREFIEKDIFETETKIKNVSQVIQALLEGPAFLIPILNKIKASVESEDLDALVIKNDAVFSYLKIRDKKILSKIKSFVDIDIFKKIQEVFENAASPSKASPSSQIDYAAFQKLNFLITEVLPKEKAKLNESIILLRSLKVELTAKERQLATAPDIDSLKDLNRALHDKNREYETSALQLSDLKQVFRQTEIELNAYKKLLNKELEFDLESYTTQNHQSRVLFHIPKVCSTLKAFSERVLQRHVGALEVKITECFQYLIRKPDFIRKVNIDPIDFKLSLLDEELNPVPFSLLSAGERQVLATSVLWGLSKVSGRPIPLVIDTPLGRLDSNHRGNLVQRYFPTASHQVILLSTDEEIVNGYHETLKPFISNTFLLDFDSKKKCSSIKESYFNE